MSMPLTAPVAGALPEGITNPPIDDLLGQVSSKYALVIYAAKRARQINDYYSQLGEGLLENVGPMVPATPEEKPLSIALREIREGMLQYTEIDPEAELAERPSEEAAFSFVNPFDETDSAS